MIREVLRGSLTTPGWHPEETVPKLPQQDAQKPWGGHPSCDGTADYLPPWTVGQWPPATGQWRTERKGHHVISVRRNLTKNRTGLPQKSSEPCHFSAREKGEGAQGPRCAQGKGTQGHRCANSEWRRTFSCSFKVVAATACTRAGSSWLRFFPTVGKQQSRLGLVTLTQDASIPASSRLRAVDEAQTTCPPSLSGLFLGSDFCSLFECIMVAQFGW